MYGIKIVAAAIWSSALIIGYSKIATQAKALADQRDEILEPPPLTSLSSDLIDVLTLGFRPVYDHFVTMWTLQFLYDANIDKYSPEQIHQTLVKTTRHHPKSPGLYMSGCFYLAFHRERPDLCESIILDGMKAVPHDWRLPAAQGFMAAFKLKDINKAIVYYSIAVNTPGSPPFMKTAVYSLKKLGRIDTNTLNTTLKSVAGDRRDSQIADFIQQVIDAQPPQTPRDSSPTDEEISP